MTNSTLIYCFFAMFIGVGFNSIAQSKFPNCRPSEFRHACIGEETTPEGVKIVGEFRNGEPSGQGVVTMITPDGKRLVMELKDGNPIGSVTITWPNGQRYIGRLDQEGQPTGVGEFTWPDGLKYNGELKKGKRDGHGTVIFPNGTKYVGDFLNDQAEGQGLFTWPDGRKYVGEFKADVANGRGTVDFPDGRIYTGDVVTFKLNGTGVMTWRDGQKYVGEFKEDQAHGRGTYIWPDGRIYVGEFKENTLHGQGTLANAVGEKYVGEFKEGTKDGRGIEYRADGTILKGGRWRGNVLVETDAPALRTPGQNYSSEEPTPPQKNNYNTISSTGTGFFVSLRGHLMTNSHVVSGCKRLMARWTSGETFATKLVAVDTQNDLALLKSERVSTPAAFRKGSAPLGEVVTVFGFPLAGTLAVSGNLTTGSISALAGLGNNPSKYQVSAPVQPGNSGGAVLDESGLVIGVVQSKLDAMKSLETTGDIPQNINFAIKASVAQNFLQAHGVKYIEKPQTSPRKASAIADDAIRFTVLIACFK